MSDEMEVKRILFVDDSSNILSGLKRMLRCKRKTWEMSFALGAQQAVAELNTRTFDVIVSDMRMPEMDGAALLTKVKEEYPHMVRIILSGFTDLEATIRAVPVVHQFLRKPTNADQLQEVVDRACALQCCLNNEAMQNIIGKIGRLPSLPHIYFELNEALLDDKISFEKIAKIIEQDLAISAKILQLVNSSFFGVAKKITNIADSVGLLGFNMLKNIVLSVGSFGVIEYGKMVEGFSVERLTKKSLIIANLTNTVARENSAPNEDAFISGMLSDIGYLVMAAYLPDKLTEIITLSHEKNQPLITFEQQVLGVTHADIGAYLLGIWGLPCTVVEAVAFHQNPMSVKHTQFGIFDAVYIAETLYDAHQNATADDETLAKLAYLDEFQVLHNFNKWKKSVAEAVTATSDMS